MVNYHGDGCMIVTTAQPIRLYQSLCRILLCNKRCARRPTEKFTDKINGISRKHLFMQNFDLVYLGSCEPKRYFFLHDHQKIRTKHKNGRTLLALFSYFPLFSHDATG